MCTRTPLSASTKRCLDKAFDHVEEDRLTKDEQNVSKRSNLGHEDQQNTSGKIIAKFGK